MKKRLFIVVMGLLFITLTACSGQTQRDKPLVFASLFPQYDMARQIGGEHVDVEFLLPPGVDAHSYEPTPRRVLEILDADLLLYTGNLMEPWIPRLISPVDNHNLTLVDLSKNINLIHQDYSTDNNDESYAIDDDFEDNIHTFELLNRRDDETTLAYVHEEHWHGSLPTISPGEVLSLGAHIVSSDKQVRELDSEGVINGLVVSLRDGMPTDIVALENHGDYVHIRGLNEGITQVEFHWVYEGQIRYTTAPINVHVGQSDDPYGLLDPHIWMDPLNAIQMAKDVRDAFIDLLPEHEADFTANAQAYIDDLYQVHLAFQQMVENSELSVIMHGGHNVFGYFAHRYGLSYVNPYKGFSPDAEPTPQALANMMDLMNDLTIDHLFSEILIDPKVADSISEETGAIILYLYAGENLPIDLLESGFTYLDLLNHNLEQFKIGLKHNAS